MLKGNQIKIRETFQEMKRCLNITQKKKTSVMETKKIKQEGFS